MRALQQPAVVLHRCLRPKLHDYVHNLVSDHGNPHPEQVNQRHD